jgi:hypothetical protein
MGQTDLYCFLRLMEAGAEVGGSGPDGSGPDDSRQALASLLVQPFKHRQSQSLPRAPGLQIRDMCPAYSHFVPPLSIDAGACGSWQLTEGAWGPRQWYLAGGSGRAGLWPSARLDAPGRWHAAEILALQRACVLRPMLALCWTAPTPPSCTAPVHRPLLFASSCASSHGAVLLSLDSLEP